MKKNIVEILEDKKEYMELDKELNKTFINFITKELKEKKSLEQNIIIDLIEEIQNYMNEGSIREKIFEKTYKLIENNEKETNYKGIIEKIYKNNYINRNTLDIVSSLIEFIKENIFNKNIKKVLAISENKNILTNLIDIKKTKENSIDKNLFEKIIKNYLDEI